MTNMRDAQSTISRMLMAMMSATYVQYASWTGNPSVTLIGAYSPAISSKKNHDRSRNILFRIHLLLRRSVAVV